jgi:hypothetical protein
MDTGCQFPMMDGRQRLACKPGVGGRLEPTDTGNRVLALPFGIGSFFPGSRPRLARLIDELTDGLLP